MEEMTRRTVKCKHKHTPQSPNKNRIRRNMLETFSRKDCFLTISHGALEACMMLRHTGQIISCDIDDGVFHSTVFASGSEFIDLRLEVLGCDVQTAVKEYCRNQSRYGQLGAVDIDLAFCIKQCEPILQSVLATLQRNYISTNVFLTFRNGRDQFSSLEDRIWWLQCRLPPGIKLVKVEPYSSGGIRSDASRSKGSAMCIIHMRT